MSASADYVVVEGIKCYAPELCRENEFYMSEGLDVTNELEEQSFWCRSRNRILNDLILRYGRVGEAATPREFLDVGCGTGFFLRGLAAAPNLRLTGAEVLLNGLKYAQAHLPQAEFIQLDARAIPFSDRFDIIGAFDVLEHIDDDRAVMISAARALKDEGLFVVSVPQYMSLWSPLDDLVRHKRRYSRRELAGKLRDAGFDVVYATSFVFLLFPAMVAVRLLDRGRSTDRDEKAEFDKRVRFPGFLNQLLDALMRVDEFFIRVGLSLPMGGSLAVVARKRPRTLVEGTL